MPRLSEREEEVGESLVSTASRSGAYQPMRAIFDTV